MIGKMVLPVLGGTPAVWTTCLVYFQVMLLVGYLFAHGAFTPKAPGFAAAAALYLSVLALLWTLGYGIQPIEIGPETSKSWSAAHRQSASLACWGSRLLCPC